MAGALWLRSETKPLEQRTPLVPADVATLVQAGHEVFVETSTLRALSDQEYREAGCRIVEAESWRTAPPHVYVLGLKELPVADAPLAGKHIYFAHAYKQQAGADDLLRRFAAGGGQLYDLEYLVDDDGRRVAAFGYWAGFMGAALGAALYCHQRAAAADAFPPVNAFPSRASVVEWVKMLFQAAGGTPRALVIGAKGRSGHGATDLLQAAGAEVVQWDLEETRRGGPFPEILDHDLLVNCVLVTSPTPPFLTREMLHDARRLIAVSDVSCDPTSPFNPLPIYDAPTSLAAPARALVSGSRPLAITAVDHLPSLLPRESSEDFSHQLLPHIRALLDSPAGLPAMWRRAQEVFTRHLARVRAGTAVSNA